MDGIGRMRPGEHEAFEERAAIVEFDGGWPRPIAEAEARRMIGMQRWLQAHPGPPIADRDNSSDAANEFDACRSPAL
jgi:hypothetical protein